MSLIARTELVRIGRILRPCGLEGALWAQPETTLPEEYPPPAELILDGGRGLLRCAVRSWDTLGGYKAGQRWRILLEGISTRETAEPLRSAELFLEPHALPAQGSETYFQDDLIGCLAVNEAGVPLGKVSGILSTRENDVLELRLQEGGASLLLPFTEEIVREVALSKRRIVVRPLPGMAPLL